MVLVSCCRGVGELLVVVVLLLSCCRVVVELLSWCC